MISLQTFGDQLAHVLDGQPLLRAGDLAAEIEHGQTEGARGGHGGGAGGQQLLGADDVDAFLGLHLHPHVTAAAAAAEPALAGVRRVDHGEPGHGGRRAARRVHDAVVAAEVARVVEDDGAVDGLDRLDAAMLHEVVDHLGVVQHLVGAAELRELVLDGVEAVRAVRDDLLELVPVDVLDVLGGHRLVEVLLAQPPRDLAVAALLLHHAEGHAGLLEDDHHRARDGLVALDDDPLGRERGARQVRGARGLAAAALHAGREVQASLPRELFQLADAERFRLLDVLDLSDLAARGELGEEDVQRRGEHVDEVGVRDDGDEEERQRGVAEPHAQVRAAQRALTHPGREHPLPERPADGGPRRPPRLRDGQPAGLQHEAGEVDDEEQGEDAREAGGRIHAGRAQHEAAPHGHAEADHEEEAEEVEHGLVEEVEAALEELVAPERQRDVVVDGGEHGAHEQREEAPEHDRVHDAGVGLRQRPGLAERVPGHELHALGNVVEAVLGSPGAPQAHVPVDAVEEDHHRDQATQVERALRERRDVPERVANRHAGRRHEGSNDITGRMAAAAEYGSRAPATTSSNTALTRPAWSARSTRPRNASTSSASNSARARSRRRAAKAPPPCRAARWRRISASSSWMPTPCWACSESTGVSHSMSRREAVLEACRCAANFSSAISAGAPARPALFATKTSATSMSPAFIVWVASPDSGTSTTTVVSAIFMMSSSVCPTPTVSISTQRYPAAPSSLATSPVACARPPSEPRVAMLRMNTPASSACACIRMRSPSTAPPENGLEGSTATMPTVSPSARSSAVRRSTTVDLPAPGGPVTPTT